MLRQCRRRLTTNQVQLISSARRKRPSSISRSTQRTTGSDRSVDVRHRVCFGLEVETMAIPTCQIGTTTRMASGLCRSRRKAHKPRRIGHAERHCVTSVCHFDTAQLAARPACWLLGQNLKHRNSGTPFAASYSVTVVVAQNQSRASGRLGSATDGGSARRSLPLIDFPTEPVELFLRPGLAPDVLPLAGLLGDTGDAAECLSRFC